MTQNGIPRPAETRQAAERLEYIDIAKGIGIFLVVLGHSIDRDTFLSNWINSFHMPLFFFLSGLCFNDAKYTEFMPFLKKRVSTLLLPLLYFCVILTVLSALVHIDYYTVDNFLDGHFAGAMWFIYVLFVSELFYWFINRVVRQKAVRVVVLFVCFAIGVALDRFGISLPFNHCTVFVATFFYGVGHLCRGSVAARVREIPAIGGGGYC